MTTTLKTVLQEPRIIADALIKGQVTLPKNYWRSRLCCLFFCKDGVDDLYQILKTNFCPLFWTSNFLLLIAPIWLPIYGVIFLALLFGEALTTYIDTMREKRRENRRLRTLRAKEVDRLQLGHFDPEKPIFERLENGRSRFYPRLKDYKSKLNIPKEQLLPLDHPELIKLVDADVLYYINFMRHYGDTHKVAFEDVMNKYYARLEALVKAREKRKQLMDKWFAKVFTRCKKVATAILLVVGVVASVALCYFIFLGVVQATPYVLNFIHWCFVVNWDVTWRTLAAIPILLALMWIVSLVLEHSLFDRFVFTPIGNVAEKVAPVTNPPIIWVFTKFANACSLVANFIKMFFSKNCPGIVYTDEDKV
jgi:hypothetical protein